LYQNYLRSDLAQVRIAGIKFVGNLLPHKALN
jgi:hypothetical protein